MPRGRRFGPGRPGQGPGQGGGNAADPNARRKEQLDKIKELFQKALAYDAVVARAPASAAMLPPRPDPRLEALVPYARGDKPVIFHAEQQVEILDALDLTRELKLKAVISGGVRGLEGRRGAQEGQGPRAGRRHAATAPAGIRSVRRGLCQPGEAARRGRDLRDPFASPAGPATTTATRNLPYEAAAAVAFGLPEDAAIQSVTLAPARILGVADQVGSLEPGKRANLVVTAGHILQPTTPVWPSSSTAQPIRPESRHTQLYAKYRRRLDEVRARPRRAWESNRPRPARSAVAKRRTSGAPGPNSRSSLRWVSPRFIAARPTGIAQTTCAVTFRVVEDHVLVGCAGSSADAAVRGPEAGEWRRYDSSTRPNWSA